MGKPNRENRGRGAARRTKERRLGIDQVDGLNKPMLDKMHHHSGEKFGLGIGVLLREEHRWRTEVAALEKLPWYRRMLPSAVLLLRTARREYRDWDEKIRECASAVAQELAPR